MENSVTLVADNSEELNKLIDIKLKEGYLLSGGAIKGEEGMLNQLMIQPNNIDPELTLASGIKLAIFAVIYGTIVYFVF